MNKPPIDVDVGMSDELQTRLTRFLDAIEQTAGQAGEFVTEQTPLVAIEYVQWHLWSNVVLIGVGVFLFCLIGIAMRLYCFCKARYKQHVNDWHTGMIVSFALGVALFIGGSITVIGGSYGVTKSVVAPRVVILEKVQDLLGN